MAGATRLLAVVFGLLMAGGDAMAGAWPREAGGVFLSLSGTVELDPGDFPLPTAARGGVYAEYGITERWTVGLDASYAQDGTDKLDALVFLRHPVWENGSGAIAAAEFGIGVRQDPEAGTGWRVRPGVSFGKGFSSDWGDGWLGVESSLGVAMPGPELTLKLDATAGLKPSENWMMILSAQSEWTAEDGVSVKLAPSVVRRVGARSHVQLGLVIGLTGDQDIGIKFANWVQF